MRRRKSGTQENSLEGWAAIIEEQGRQMRGEGQSTRVDCAIDDSGPYPTEREVQEGNAPGEPLDPGVETPPDRCSRGLHEQMESEPWRCVYDEHHVDVNPPDASKLVLVFCPWLVAERSDSHNWTLKQRRRVESGANAGKHAWKDVGYYGTPGQAATKAMLLMVESSASTGGVHIRELVELLVQTEEGLRGVVERAAASEARSRALSEAVAVVKGEEDKQRIRKLLGGSES